MEWLDPPIAPPYEGRCVLVLLDPSELEGVEYYGEPVCVRFWGSKLKTTFDYTRIETRMILKWMPVPDSKLLHGFGS